MSDALRPSSLFTPAPPTSAPSGVLATLPNPPPEVSQLPAGTTIRGTVVGHDDHGHLLVRTDLGTLAVATKANPPPGSDVVLQIRSSGAQLHVLLMQSDPVANGAGQRLATPPLGSGAPLPDRLTLERSIRAVLQAPAASGTAAATGPGAAASLEPALLAALARLIPGSQIAIRILAVEPPAGALGSPGAAPPSALWPGAPQTTGGIPGTAGSPVSGAPAPGGGPLAPAAAQPVLPIQAPSSTPTAAPLAAGGALARGPSPGAAAAAQLAAIPPSPTRSGTAAPASPPGPGTIPGPAAQPAPPAQPGAPVASPGVQPAAPAAPAVGSPHAASILHHPVAAAGPAAIAPNPYAVTANAPVTANPVSTGTDSAMPRFTGVVTATTNAGHPVLQTPIGTLTLEAPAALTVGSRVIFDLAPGSLAHAAAGAPLEPDALPALPGSLARAWPEVEEVIRALHELAPPGAPGGVGGTVIPQPGPRLASGLLFFLAAISGGDISRWLGGQAAQALKDAGRGNLLARLGQDFGHLGRHVESGGTDWRLFLIPMLDGHQVQQIRFFERHGSHRRGANRGSDGESTRFILEVELTRLGDMQLDGLVRDRRFDLMLRTRRPLPDAMRHKITEIFSEANDAACYAGTIGFQAARDWRFIPVAGEAPAGAGAGLVI